MEHVVYTDKKAKVLERLIDGTKTMIVRGAAGRKMPYGRVFEGDTLYFINNDGSGVIRAKSVVKNVFNSEKMTKEESEKVIEDNQDKLQLTKAQIKRWAGKKYLCLVEVNDVVEIEGLELDRQKNMDDWIAVEDINSIIKNGEETVYRNIRYSEVK